MKLFFIKFFLVPFSLVYLTGCAASMGVSPNDPSIVKKIIVASNMKKSYADYFKEGLNGSTALNFTGKYALQSLVKTDRNLDMNQVSIMFYNQDKVQVLEMGLEIDTDFEEEKKFKSTIDILIGEILKATKEYNAEKEKRIKHASTMKNIPVMGIASSDTTEVPDFDSATNTRFKPIPLPKI